MKKSSFVALVLGTVSGMLFAIGMCMALLPAWDAMQPGIVLGGVGLVLGLVTWLVWRKMAGKESIRVTGKALLTILIAVVGALGLGVGMCFCLAWENMLVGIPVGLVGILVLLALIPFTKGLKD